MYEFYSMNEVELAEFWDANIFSDNPTLLEAAVRCVKRQLEKSERSYRMAATALPESPMHVVGTKRAMETIRQCQNWLAEHT